ncbi:MAG: SAM-dependent methyltransferase [Pseudomonadota bacterium]|nr:SAM-dependent methyltransferase [Rubrivivax sp.]NLZ43152.1 class I SAM-dependent methyltransferase [Comamonadaceae bacterium]
MLATIPDVDDAGHEAGAGSLSGRLRQRLAQAIAGADGWLSFERFMSIALYEPGLGYYARGAPVFGTMPGDGSDFVTAPELSPLFAQALARQLAQALDAVAGRGGAGELYEFGAGSGALAAQLLEALAALGVRVARCTIVELSGALRARQRERLAPFGERVRWLDAWPERIEGVVIGNEVLDAMPVTLLAFDGAAWHERGVTRDAAGAFAWADRPTAQRPPVDAAFVPGTVTEIHPQAEAFVRSLAERLVRGAAFFVDYGYPAAEYYLPQRHQGTLMCHRRHRADADPLVDVGAKDITAHVDFSGIALAAQDAGLDVIGYTSQARFLLNCGLAELLQGADLRARTAALRLVNEHEMGELFKVIGLTRGVRPEAGADWIGFAAGDRTHRL